MKNDNAAANELLFIQLVSMFQMAAMQQLGKLIDPVTQEVKRDLEQAKVSIDILDMIKEKTKGNLTKDEEDFVGKVLFELHMNYVDELKRAEAEGEATEDKKESDPTDTDHPEEKMDGDDEDGAKKET